MATANNATKQTPATAQKETIMANEKDVDISKLSYADLQKLIEQASEARDNKRSEEIKVLADAYAKKSTAAGFSVQEAIDALYPYLPAKAARKPRAAKGTATKKEVAFVRGTTYKDPQKQGKDWTAGGLGAKPKWLKELVDNLPFEDQKKKYAELAAK